MANAAAVSTIDADATHTRATRGATTESDGSRPYWAGAFAFQAATVSNNAEQYAQRLHSAPTLSFHLSSLSLT
jgi:hypothetical protein